MSQEKMLEIVDITEAKEAKDGRKYKTVYFKPEPEIRNGKRVISNQPPRARNVWDKAPDGESRGDELFHTAKIGDLVPGTIETYLVEDFFIPSVYGKSEHNGQTGNWVNQYTTPVFEHENGFRLVRNQNHNPITEDGTILDNNGHPIEGQDVATNIANEQKFEEEEEESF